MAVVNQRARTGPPRERNVDTLVELAADGGPRLGFGHVGRCLALWEELRGRATFRVNDASVAGFLRERHAPTVGAGDAPIVVLDRAAPVAEEEVRQLRACGRRVVLLDDLGPARMIADSVIDPPTAAAWPPAAGIRLAGFEHVLLRREVRAAALESAPRGGVLLALGGSDPAGLTPILADALNAAGIDVTVALGPGYRGLSPTTGTVLGGPEAFIPALACADLLLTGYGHSLLEAAHLGVPAIAVVHRPEHVSHAVAFCREGTARMLDITTRAHAGRVADLAVRLLAQPAVRAEMAARGRELVDGLGARRVVETLEALA
jgi:UDP-2,4-diacetamido-2,4,6-trideoxy-beta-L-altropyranose hydrolase